MHAEGLSGHIWMTANCKFIFHIILLEYRKTAEIVDMLREEAVQIGIEMDRQNEILPDGINTIKETSKELQKRIHMRRLNQH